MISWRLITKSVQASVVIGLILGATILYCGWLFFGSPEKRAQREERIEAKREEIRKTVATVENRLQHLVLVDNNLLDADNGKIYFKGWLEEGFPIALYSEPSGKNMLAQYPNGFVRYALDGSRQAALLHRFSLPFTKDHEWATFCKDGNVWRADVDWQKLVFINERQVTQTGGFDERYFAENLLFATDNILVVRNGAKMLKVTLESGDVAPVNYPLDGLARRRSPNARHLVGIKDGGLFCHDAETNETKSYQLAGRPNDYLWLDDERCVVLVAGQKVLLFDRVKGVVEENAMLPIRGDRMGQVSPGKAYLLTSSREGICVVNLQKKKAGRIIGGDGIGWIGEDTLLFSRNVMDSAKRGTWTQKSGEGEKRVWNQPYVTGRKGELVTGIKEAGIVLFGTKDSLVRMNNDGSDVREVIRFEKLFGGNEKYPARIAGIKRWQAE